MKHFVLAVLLCAPILAWSQVRYVELPDGHSVAVDYQEAKPGKPTIVLINGLVYEFPRWNDMIEPLAAKGYGVLRYYFRGQILTLKKEVERTGTPAFFSTGLKEQDFVSELSALLDTLGLERVHVVGLSYGATIATNFATTHPDRVRELVLMAPYAVASDRLDPQGKWVRLNLDALRLSWGPLWGPYAYDYYYNWIFRNYLEKKITEDRIPRSMRDMPDAYKESVFHLVRAVRDFELKSHKLPKLPSRVNLMVASNEESLLLPEQLAAWEKFTPRSRGSLLYLKPAEHALPDTAPEASAEWLAKIFAGDSASDGGKIYYWDSQENAEPEALSSLAKLRERIKE